MPPFALLQLALQRRFDMPAAQLLNTRLLQPLGMTSTTLPVPGAQSRGELAPAFTAPRGARLRTDGETHRHSR